jgi:hypothetical protein
MILLKIRYCVSWCAQSVEIFIDLESHRSFIGFSHGQLTRWSFAVAVSSSQIFFREMQGYEASRL